MFATLKAIPVLPKIFFGFLLLLVIFGLTHRSHHQSEGYTFAQSGPATEEQASYSDRGEARAQGASEAELAQQYLAQFKAQQVQVQARAQDCMAQMQQATNQIAIAAMNGQMMGGPACEQYMPQLTAQEAYLETVIYQLQTGDVHSTMRQITGVQAGQSSGAGESSYYRPSGPGNDGGIGAVERYSRQAIRGNSLYDEPDGTEHELPTEPYYFRNQNTGQIVSTTLPDPPNDGRPYEPLTPQE